ncbi:MAG: hypothetical protein ACJ76R_02675 [Solirubrobacteraceae bacterium]
MTPLALLTPSSIGSVEIRNRVIRSSTSETMADEDGFVTPRYRALHQALARGGVGLIFTGHSYVHPSGKSIAGMTGVHDDDHIPLLHRLTDAVHAEERRSSASCNTPAARAALPTTVADCRPTAHSSPRAPKIAAPASHLRPSRPIGQPITTRPDARAVRDRSPQGRRAERRDRLDRGRRRRAPVRGRAL